MSRTSVPPLKERVPEVIRLLSERHADAHCELNFSNAYELIVSVILSAQCTDKRVNLVTPALFERYPSVEALAEAEQGELEGIIHSTGFYRSKAKNLIGMAQRVVSHYEGRIPDEMEELVTLSGVARKTANVVLGDWYDKQEGFTVDTHVTRITRKLGFTRHRDPIKIEKVMMKLVPREQWTLFAHVLVFHGRRICIARRPKCEECPVNHLCPSSEV